MAESDPRLTPLDSTFLELEQADEGAMMHIGGALIFEAEPGTGRTPSLDAVTALLAERLAMLPRFHCRLSEKRVHGLRRPAWVEDPSFDVRAQVRHATLPAPGGDAQLHEWLGDLWSHRLDRGRPLWEMTLVDGLADGGWMLGPRPITRSWTESPPLTSATSCSMPGATRLPPLPGRPHGRATPTPPPTQAPASATPATRRPPAAETRCRAGSRRVWPPASPARRSTPLATRAA
jgi:hypothetical protein